jgi:superfamily II DNA/RNA helicase
LYFNADEGVAPGEEDLMGQFAMPAEIQEFCIICEDEGAKPLLLFCLVLQKRQKVLCFTSTRLAAHRLALLLSEISTRSKQQCLVVAEISADLHIHERDSILAKFSRGEIDM